MSEERGSPVADVDRLDAADVVDLNRAAIARSAALARLTGSILIAIGAVGLALAVYVNVRAQLQLGESLGTFGTIDGPIAPGPSLNERISTLANGIAVVLEGVAMITFGLLLRMLADYVLARSGASITGYLPGDEAPPPPPTDAEDEGR